MTDKQLFQYLKNYYNIDIDINNMTPIETQEMINISLLHTQLLIRNNLKKGDR